MLMETSLTPSLLKVIARGDQSKAPMHGTPPAGPYEQQVRPAFRVTFKDPFSFKMKSSLLTLSEF